MFVMNKMSYVTQFCGSFNNICGFNWCKSTNVDSYQKKNVIGALKSAKLQIKAN